MSYSLFEHGVSAAQISANKKQQAAQARAKLVLGEWQRSEGILNILRTIKPTVEKATPEVITRWFNSLPGGGRASLPAITQEGDLLGEARVNSANEWFTRQFPEVSKQYGPALFESASQDLDGLRRIEPYFLNDDFFAGILGGDPRLGHRVVFYPPENRFYFLDHRVGAYVPTSEAKLEILLSNYLMRCSQGCGYAVDKMPLVAMFRQKKTLKGIVEQAKAMLEADSTFFQGKDGHRRYIDGKYVEATDEPSYRLFVKTALVRQPEARMTLSDAYSLYYRFCSDAQMPPLTRSDFKALMKEAIQESFGLGFRHDVPDGEGKQSHGWYGLDCRLPDQLVVSRN